MKTIKERWEEYLDKAVPKNAGPVQITESKNAFYAGTLVTMGLLLDLIDMEDIEAKKALSKLYDEAVDFAKEIINESVN